MFSINPYKSFPILSRTPGFFYKVEIIFIINFHYSFPIFFRSIEIMENKSTLITTKNSIFSISSHVGKTKSFIFKAFILLFSFLGFSNMSYASHCPKAHVTEQTRPQYVETLKQQAKKCLTESQNTQSCCSSIENVKVCCKREADTSSINCQTEE